MSATVNPQSGPRGPYHPPPAPSQRSDPENLGQGGGFHRHGHQGERYIDGLAGLWNVNIGHGRQELADAAPSRWNSWRSSRYTGASNQPAIRLAERLAELAYPSINRFFFTSGGAESTESSFKTARFYWKAIGKPDKIKVISRHRAYHGVTLAAMSATGMPAFWPMFEPRMPGFLHIESPYPYFFNYEHEQPGDRAPPA